MAENTASAKCTDAEWEAARDAGLLFADLGSTSQEAAIHAFAEAIRAQAAITFKEARAEQALERVCHSASLADAVILSAKEYGKACADELPEAQERWLDDIAERVEAIQQDCYAEGRKDEREECLARAALPANQQKSPAPSVPPNEHPQAPAVRCLARNCVCPPHADNLRRSCAIRDAAEAAAACPKCGDEGWDHVTAERGRERDVPFNRCARCGNEWEAQ